MTTQNNLRLRKCDKPDGCGAEFMGGPRAWYCPACRHARKAEATKAYKARRREGLSRPLGSVDQCIICGGDYIVESGQQTYCPACAPAAIRAVDAVQGLAYYYAHADEINPPRMLARRKGPRPCVVCGKMYDSPTCRITCSDDCALQYRRARNRKYEARRQAVRAARKRYAPETLGRRTRTDTQ